MPGRKRKSQRVYIGPNITLIANDLIHADDLAEDAKGYPLNGLIVRRVEPTVLHIEIVPRNVAAPVFTLSSDKGCWQFRLSSKEYHRALSIPLGAYSARRVENTIVVDLSKKIGGKWVAHAQQRVSGKSCD